MKLLNCFLSLFEFFILITSCRMISIALQHNVQRARLFWFYHLVVSFDVPYIRQTGIFLRIDVNNTTKYTIKTDVLLLPLSPNYSAFLKNTDSI